MKKILLFIKLLFEKNKPIIIRFQCSGTLGEMRNFDSLGEINSINLKNGIISYTLLIGSDSFFTENIKLIAPFDSLIKIGTNTYKYLI